MHRSSRYKHNNYRKHKTEKRRSCDVIQESAGTTVSQKDTVARMTGHFNCVPIDFHFADSRGVVRQLQKRLPVSMRQVASSSSGYKQIAISEFRDLCGILAIGEKIIAPLPIAAAPGNIA